MVAFFLVHGMHRRNICIFFAPKFHLRSNKIACVLNATLTFPTIFYFDLPFGKGWKDGVGGVVVMAEAAMMWRSMETLCPR